MALKYQHLLSPIKIGNIVLKNRLTASSSHPYYIQGPETFPTESMITHFANKAKNGAAVVTCTGVSPVPVAAVNKNNHDVEYDMFDAHSQVHLSMLTEAIHFYGSKASMQIRPEVPEEYDVSSGVPSFTIYGDGREPKLSKEIPAAMLDGIAEGYARQCATLQRLGFDMIYLHMTYRALLPARFLSPLTNKRNDEFGGSLENRARFPIMIFDRIRQRCGEDFLIEAGISGEEPPGGYTLEEAIAYARLFEGHIDLLQLRAGEIDPAHPTGYNPETTPFLYMADVFKQSGIRIPVVTVGGYQDLDVCEDVIASGKADLIAMARNWISNPDYGRLAYEGRNEDVVPCIRCNKCHTSSPTNPWVSVCSVNPVYGFEHRIDKLVEPPIGKKRVAVVGGGPAGMEAALIAARRGHDVTLYERTNALGGYFKTCDNVSFKWPHRNFKNYLIRQVGKAGVRVHLNTEADPEQMKEQGYDAVVAAVGAEPVIPPLPGVAGANVSCASEIYGREDTLEKDVVIIGGGEIGVETGIHLAERGYNITVIEMREKLAPDATLMHFYSMFEAAWQKLPNFKYIVRAWCTSISSDGVTFQDEDGKEHSISAGSVLIAAGMKPKSELALRYVGVGERFYLVGDCIKAGDLQKALRSAYAIASTI